MTEIRYVGGSRPLDEVSAEIDVILAELGRDPSVRGELTPEEWEALRTGISLRATGIHDVTSMVVEVVAAPAASHVFMSLWDQVILPRLRYRLGDDVIGEEQRDEALTSTEPPAGVPPAADPGGDLEDDDRDDEND